MWWGAARAAARAAASPVKGVAQMERLVGAVTAWAAAARAAAVAAAAVTVAMAVAVPVADEPSTSP